VLDLRSASEHAETRIPGSKSLPLSRVPVTDLDRLTNHSSQEIHLVCGSGRLSSIAYDSLHGSGVHQVVVVEGGLGAWMQTGLPLERTPGNAFSVERQIRIAAGSLVLLGLVLGWLVHPAFAGLAGLVGCCLAFSGWHGMAALPAPASGNELASSQPAKSPA